MFHVLIRWFNCYGLEFGRAVLTHCSPFNVRRYTHIVGMAARNNCNVRARNHSNGMTIMQARLWP
jgi:hypothetical protein